MAAAVLRPALICHRAMRTFPTVRLLGAFPFASAATVKPPCAKADNRGDCTALSDLAKSAKLAGWTKKTHWLEDKSVCTWYGVTCTKGRVTGISLKSNNLAGSLPASLGSLTELTSLAINGKRPPGYGPHSCVKSGGTNFNNSALPRSFYALSKLQLWSMEYTCLGGTLAPELGNMLSLEQIWIHGNFLSGTLPPELDNLENLVDHKLGRNPISGTLPAFTKPKLKLAKYNCNFCALTGTFPDSFSPAKFPVLSQAYWDGNGFSGTLPGSIGTIKSMTTMSFNINNFGGEFPTAFCGTKATDCRIGADAGRSWLAGYQAIYPWTLAMNASGNRYTCSGAGGVPGCIRSGGVCNHTSAPHPGQEVNGSAVVCNAPPRDPGPKEGEGVEEPS